MTTTCAESYGTNIATGEGTSCMTEERSTTQINYRLCVYWLSDFKKDGEGVVIGRKKKWRKKEGERKKEKRD